MKVKAIIYIDDQFKKTPFKPQHGKFHKKGKGKDKKIVAAQKWDGETPYCTYFKKDGQDEDCYNNLHLELRPKRFGGKGKQKTMETTQDLGSDSSDEPLITVVGVRGTLSINDSFDSVASTSYLNEPVSNE